MVEIIDKIVADLAHVSGAVDSLRWMGYSLTFHLFDKDYLVGDHNQLFKLKNFQIDHIYRFEKNTALEQYYVFAMRERWTGVKGLMLVDYEQLTQLRLLP